MTVLDTLNGLLRRRFGQAPGLDDDLFSALEIDSLKALELLTELEEAFQIEIPDYELQEVRTVRGLVALVEERT